MPLTTPCMSTWQSGKRRGRANGVALGPSQEEPSDKKILCE